MLRLLTKVMATIRPQQTRYVGIIRQPTLLHLLIALPPEWSSMDDASWTRVELSPSESETRVELSPSESEYRSVVEHFKKSDPNYNYIVKVCETGDKNTFHAFEFGDR